jgi:hypothetical protein
MDSGLLEGFTFSSYECGPRTTFFASLGSLAVMELLSVHQRREVLYRSRSQGAQLKGFGIRFCEISSEDEASLIEYLAWLESAT